MFLGLRDVSDVKLEGTAGDSEGHAAPRYKSGATKWEFSMQVNSHFFCPVTNLKVSTFLCNILIFAWMESIQSYTDTINPLTSDYSSKFVCVIISLSHCCFASSLSTTGGNCTPGQGGPTFIYEFAGALAMKVSHNALEGAAPSAHLRFSSLNETFLFPLKCAV